MECPNFLICENTGFIILVKILGAELKLTGNEVNLKSSSSQKNCKYFPLVSEGWTVEL